jgi:hypothetical protein
MSELTCIVCQEPFERKGKRGPIPKYCSIRCSSAVQRAKPERKEYERQYFRRPEQQIRRQSYAFRYNRRPEVKARNRERMRIKWWADADYRQSQLERLRNYMRRANPFKDVVVPVPYTGHRWLDMARQAVAPHGFSPEATWAEDYNDDMGEAVLALLEGRDMKEAVKQYRRREYVSRYLTTRWSEYKDEDGHSYADWFMPWEPSAEEEVVAIESVRVAVKSKFYRKGGMSRKMKHRTQQPSRRRMKDGKSWLKHAKSV